MSGAASGAAQGATAGAAFGPWGAAIGAVAGGLLGSGSGGGAMPAGPSSNYSDAVFDNSGWTVATGGSRAESKADKSTGLDIPAWALVGIAMVLVVGWIRTGKK